MRYQTAPLPEGMHSRGGSAGRRVGSPVVWDDARARRKRRPPRSRPRVRSSSAGSWAVTGAPVGAMVVGGKLAGAGPPGGGEPVYRLLGDEPIPDGVRRVAREQLDAAG